MRIVDSHSHIYDEPGYVDNLLRAMDALSIDRSCISGLGELFGFVNDREIEKICHQYPQRFVGQVYVRPGQDTPEKIQWGAENGFKMVKVTLPLQGYESSQYFPLWEKALEYRMPVLFHTGVVNCKSGHGKLISSWNMHPMRLEPIIARYRSSDIPRFFRGDAGFADPEIYRFLESEDYSYAIRLKGNNILHGHIEHLLTRPVGRPPNKPIVVYHSFRYRAASWSIDRRVVAKIEWHAGELFPRIGFIVTNLRWKHSNVVKFYNKRGTAEQWIKEGKYALNWTRLSCHDFVDNQVRLQLFALAYN